MTAWHYDVSPQPLSPGDPDIARIPAIRGFDLDLRAVVTPEASLSLDGDDLVVGPAFGPVLAVMDFARWALSGRLMVRFSDRLVVAADRLVATLRDRTSLSVAALKA